MTYGALRLLACLGLLAAAAGAASSASAEGKDYHVVRDSTIITEAGLTTAPAGTRLLTNAEALRLAAGSEPAKPVKYHETDSTRFRMFPTPGPKAGYQTEAEFLASKASTKLPGH